MSAKITRDEVLRVAELAHLDLTDEEVNSFALHLDAILTYSEKLNELDTGGVEPMAQVVPPPGEISAAESGGAHAGTPLRDDVPRPCNIVGEVLAGAPDTDPPYFCVPKVIER